VFGWKLIDRLLRRGDMTVRKPVRAGSFYPADPGACARDASRAVEGSAPPVTDPLGGIAPHAGWVFSGHTAGRLFRVLKDSGKPFSSFLFFGAVHTASPTNALFPEGAWETPLGEVPIDAELNRALLEEGDGVIVTDAGPHAFEHSVEVLVPLALHLFPDASISVISTPPSPDALLVGRASGRAVASLDRPVAIVASTDLTHYGASYYGFAPKGTGEEALRWVKEENDARIVDAFTQLGAEAILKEAKLRHSACGSGAAAAAAACARALGGRRGVLLQYTTSHDVRPSGTPTDFVGYASVAFEGGGES